MNKLKVITVVGTRPEIIRLSRVISRLDQTCNHIIVHTGQNYDYELNEIFFRDLELKKPDYFLSVASGSAAETIGNIIIEVDKVLAKEAPDAVLILGDTNSCLAAIPAKRRKIPVFHMEAGNRCFDQRVPEEINRKIVDHISDINLPYSDIAREYLLREGIPPDRIIKTGSPMFEVLSYFKPKILQSDVLSCLGVTKDNYFLVSTHREENVDNLENLKSIFSTLNSVAEIYGLPVIVSTHPRTRKRIEAEEIQMHRNINLHKPLGFMDYVNLQLNAKVVFSDSGTISEEANILGFKALNIRQAHERPEAMEEGVVMMPGVNSARILQCLEALLLETNTQFSDSRPVFDYHMPNVSDKVVKIILSYTDYINRVVWSRRV
ncbi:MAG: UDP-N-acetylglucosamine 2-epimerase (non-hydrolyzing) [Pseudomonadota bacterium]